VRLAADFCDLVTVKISNPEYTVERIIERMKEAAARSSGASTAIPPLRDSVSPELRAMGSSTRAPSNIQPLKLQPQFKPHDDDLYHVNDLLQYHDRNFIQNAYRAILKRGPDAIGYKEFMESLHSGRLNKLDILARLRYSQEGRAKKVQVNGLLVPAAIRTIYRIPGIGYLLNLAMAIFRLPATIRSQQQFESHALAQQELIADHVNQVVFALSGEVHQVTEQLKRQLERVFQKEQQISAELALQGQRLAGVLEETRKRLSAPLDRERLQTIADEESHTLDAFYASFDEQFRGSREEIKGRLRTYLPIIAKNGVGTEPMPILDVGCGRGEWLEVLKEEQLRATGVDSNRILVAQCGNRGLEVVEEDLMDHLQHLPDASLGAVTGFHIIEHLPIETLVRFLNETVRVLKPGGVVIFETPNPENVLVGSCNFYFDPTHRNPLPSQVMKFLVESKGFVGVEILKLNPSDEAPIAGDSEIVNRFNEYFYGPMDYAVIGWRA
jgi:SAM-dependent methyltransferase